MGSPGAHFGSKLGSTKGLTGVSRSIFQSSRARNPRRIIDITVLALTSLWWHGVDQGSYCNKEMKFQYIPE